MTEKAGTPWICKLIHELTTPFSCLLWGGAALSILAYILSPADPSNLYLGIVLALVNLFTGLLSFYQNMKS